MVHVEEVSSQGTPLVNKNGKCLDRGAFDGQLVQLKCYMLSPVWHIGKDRHLCKNIMGNVKCVASPMNFGWNTNVVEWEWKDEAGQRFTFKEDKESGYFRIVNDHGKCLSVGQNSKDDWALIYAWDCNTYEDGQLWKWL